MNVSVKLKLKFSTLKKHPLGKGGVYFSRCLPFVENSRAVLIHRPKEVTLLNCLNKPHLAIGFFCGTHASGTKKFTFLEAPPEDSILCERCERFAVEAGLPSADTLAGRHVHKGKTVARATCCNIEKRSRHESDY